VKRVALTLLFVILAAAAVAVHARDRLQRDRVALAFLQSGIGARKPVIKEAARLAPYPDFSAEIYAAAAAREWLSRHPTDAPSSRVRAAIASRPPWGYPHPWRWPDGDYASEYLASIADLENRAIVSGGWDRDLAIARELLIAAIRERPGWERHRRTLEAIVLAERQ
jgi:hypothetical protein